MANFAMQPITPADKRKCRDVFWLLLFILFQCGMLTIGGFAFYYGALCHPTGHLPSAGAGEAAIIWSSIIASPPQMAA